MLVFDNYHVFLSCICTEWRMFWTLCHDAELIVLETKKRRFLFLPLKKKVLQRLITYFFIEIFSQYALKYMYYKDYFVAHVFKCAGHAPYM